MALQDVLSEEIQLSLDWSSVACNGGCMCNGTRGSNFASLQIAGAVPSPIVFATVQDSCSPFFYKKISKFLFGFVNYYFFFRLIAHSFMYN